MWSTAVSNVHLILWNSNIECSRKTQIWVFLCFYALSNMVPLEAFGAKSVNDTIVVAECMESRCLPCTKVSKMWTWSHKKRNIEMYFLEKVEWFSKPKNPMNILNFEIQKHDCTLFWIYPIIRKNKNDEGRWCRAAKKPIDDIHHEVKWCEHFETPQSKLIKTLKERRESGRKQKSQNTYPRRPHSCVSGKRYDPRSATRQHQSWLVLLLRLRIMPPPATNRFQDYLQRMTTMIIVEAIMKDCKSSSRNDSSSSNNDNVEVKSKYIDRQPVRLTYWQSIYSLTLLNVSQ